MYDVIALGELLIDFTPIKSDCKNILQKPSFEANPGGAPCNVLAALQKLCKKTAFIGKVGTDAFGVFLKKTIDDIGIDSKNLLMSKDYFTTLAFVTLDENGDRDFSFARNNSADINLDESEIDFNLLKNSRIFHCGTLSLTHEKCKKATLAALEFAKNNGIIISVDPNLREPLWNSLEDAKAAIKTVLAYADIIKISDYELEFLYGEKDVEKAAKMLFDEYKPKILFATCGKDGAYLIKDDIVLHQACFNSVKTIDTTGAGDSFCGTALSKLLDYELNFAKLDTAKCKDILEYASAAASLATTKRGAIAAMPDDKDICTLIHG